jgi:hypothetical protein
MAEKFIQKAIKHPGALTATATGAGKSISEVCNESNKSAMTGKRCALRETLMKMHK